MQPTKADLGCVQSELLPLIRSNCKQVVRHLNNTAAESMGLSVLLPVENVGE